MNDRSVKWTAVVLAERLMRRPDGTLRGVRVYAVEADRPVAAGEVLYGAGSIMPMPGSCYADQPIARQCHLYDRVCQWLGGNRFRVAVRYRSESASAAATAAAAAIAGQEGRS